MFAVLKDSKKVMLSLAKTQPTLILGTVFISAGLPPLVKDPDIIYKYQFR